MRCREAKVETKALERDSEMGNSKHQNDYFLLCFVMYYKRVLISSSIDSHWSHWNCVKSSEITVANEHEPRTFCTTVFIVCIATTHSIDKPFTFWFWLYLSQFLGVSAATGDGFACNLGFYSKNAFDTQHSTRTHTTTTYKIVGCRRAHKRLS